MDTPSNIVYTKNITVQKQHLDDLDHVNNTIYVQWIQDIASEHWLSKRTQSHTEEAYWVVLEHHIQYLRQAYLNDQLKVETFVESPMGVRFPRNVNFYRGNQLVVKARTLWCWLDKQTNRPRRITQEMLQGFL